MSNLAIIPARGGSKRIPRKNIKDFLGKPIIAYSIETAKKSKLFDEIMVSTDDEEIADIAKKFGASIPFMRSEKTSGDYALTVDVIQEVLRVYAKFGKYFDYICCIYPTAPLIQISNLKEGLEKLKNYNYDMVFPIVDFSYPIWRGLQLEDQNGKIRMVWPEFLNSRSQDLKKVYHDAGQWYWLSSKRISTTLFTENTGSIELREEFVQDIDNESDWKLAELKYKLLNY